MRQTRKYIAACKLASVPTNSDVPHEALYGWLALQGFIWQGGQWVQPKPVCTEKIEARFVGSIANVRQWRDTLVDALEHSGASDIRVSAIKKSRSSDDVRIYISWLEPEVRI